MVMRRRDLLGMTGSVALALSIGGQLAREPTAKAFLPEYSGFGALAPAMRRVACAVPAGFRDPRKARRGRMEGQVRFLPLVVEAREDA